LDSRATEETAGITIPESLRAPYRIRSFKLKCFQVEGSQQGDLLHKDEAFRHHPRHVWHWATLIPGGSTSQHKHYGMTEHYVREAQQTMESAEGVIMQI
jgi:hypothetical protein